MRFARRKVKMGSLKLFSVCVREREREKVFETEKERERVQESERVRER